MGMLMLGISWLSAFYLKRGKDLPPLLVRGLVGMTFSGWIATVAGWYVTEIGRQPYLVYGLMRTEEAASAVTSPMIGVTLTLYVITYFFLLISFITTVFYMAAKANRIETTPPQKGVPDAA